MRAPARSETRRTSGVLVYLLLLVSLQAFLLVVALEGVLAHNPSLAVAAAGLSVVVCAMSFGFRRFVIT
ncbi:MAG: DUF6755 family protein [Microthrixaceae bacterium]